MNKTVLTGYHRHDILNLLSGSSNIGVELGVAEGIFSERAIQSNKFKKYIGIDVYADRGHDINQYKRAIKRVGVLSNYSILVMRFDQAIDLFEDESLDFVYVDGYAHTGENNGETIYNWYRKVKPRGIFAGDDYDEKKWPLVYNHVNAFCNKYNYELMVTEQVEDINYCKYPTWAIIK